MKKVFFTTIVLAALVVSGCGVRSWLQGRFSGGASVSTDQEPVLTSTYVLSAPSSTLTWSLKNVRGFTGQGGAGFSSGSVTTREGVVEKMSVTLDSGSLLKNGGNTLAADHFKLDTYLTAAKYLTISFDSTDVVSVDPVAGRPTAYQVTGTIRAGFWSKQITFPMTFVQAGDTLTADGSIMLPAPQASGSASLPEVSAFLGKTGSATIKVHLLTKTK